METFIPNNLDDDQESDSNMNESGSEVEDDHDKILHDVAYGRFDGLGVG